MEDLRRLLPSPGALYVFEAAARHGSFSRAGEALGMSQAAVSYAIRNLEEGLGARLFVRRRTGVELTEAGGRFYADVAIGLAYIKRSAEHIRGRSRTPHVTVSGSTAFASYWMLPRLAAFRASFADIDLRLQTTDKDIDLAAEEIPLAVRWGSGEWPEYDTVALKRGKICAVASPAYLAAAPAAEQPADLLRHTLIHLDEPFRPRPTWRDWFEALGLDISRNAGSLARGEGLHLNDYALVLQAALDGQGVALGWRFLVDELLKAGTLVRLTSAVIDTDADFHLISPRRRELSDDALKVRDWLLGEAAAA